MDSTFKFQMEPRDHECDVQGVVNNAHYQQYFEHARHKFLLENNINFSELAKQNLNLMVKKIEIEYLKPLIAHQPFYVTVSPSQISRLKMCFEQKIIASNDNQVMATAKTIVVPVGDNLKPLKHNPINTIFNKE